MTTDGLDEGLAALLDASATIAQLTAALDKDTMVQSRRGLGPLLRTIDEMRAAAASLQDEIERRRRIVTERERLEQLRNTTPTGGEDIAVALLRGDWTTARDALTRAATADQSRLAMPAKFALEAVDALIAGGLQMVVPLESAIHRLKRNTSKRADPLCGALLVAAGRFYRDVVQNPYLARRAFEQAQALLPDAPEPLVESAELLRRSRDRDGARRGIDAALAIGAHRAAPWLAKAALDEEASSWSDAAENIGRAVKILVEERDPLAALERVQPTPLGSTYLALATAICVSLRTDAIRALDRAIAIGVCGAKPHAIAEAYRLRGDLAGAAEDLYQAGRRLLWRGDYVAATKVLESAVACDPEHGLAWMILADTYRLRMFEPGTDPATYAAHLHRAGEAVARAITAIGEAKMPGWALCTRAYLLESAANAASEPVPAAALVLTEYALLVDPDALAPLLASGRLHQKANHVRTAAALMARAYELFPGDLGVIEERVRILTNTCEYERALSLIPRLPDTSWRRGVEAVIRYKARSRTDETARKESTSAAATLMESAIATSTPDSACWMNMTLASCYFALGRREQATECFAKAQAAARSSIERAEMQIWCGDFAGSIEWAKQGIANTTDDDADLRMMLVVAYLGLGEPDEANRWLSTYLAKAAGPTAASWALYLVEDLEYVPSLASTRTERQKMAAELERCAAKSPTEEAPLEEIERLLPTAIDDMRVALHLAGGRVALEMKDRNAALRHLRGVPAEPAARLALGRLNAESVVAALAEGRLDTVRAEWSLTDDGVARMVEQFATSGTARAAAGALELLPLEHHAGILEWTATHLGLGEVALSIPALTVTIPRSLGPDRTDESKWPFLARTLPEVRRLLEDRFGITIPSILVRTEDIESIGLWIGLSKGAELPTLPAKGERIEILAAADALRRGDAREFTPHTRIAGWLLNEIGWQLSSIITVQDVADLASAEVVTPDEKSVPRVEDLVQLTRLVRSLLMEQIGVKPWLVIAEAAIANRKSSLDSALKDTRLRLTASLGGALRQAGGDDPGKLAPVPVDLELRVKAMLRNDGRNGFLAAPPEDVNAVVEGLRPLIGAAPPRILIVEDSQVRPWIRRLAGFAVANVLVFTREELAKIGVHPMETGQSRPMPAETHAV